MFDKDTAMQRHAHNLKKSAGLHGNNSVRYEYILTVDQLEDAMLKSVDDLNYPLRKEVKRDRYVLNKQALKEAIIKGSEKALNDFQHQIFVFLQNDVNKLIERNVFNILSDVMSLGDPTNRSDDTNHWAYKLGASFGLAIGNAIWDYVEDMIDPNKRNVK